MRTSHFLTTIFFTLSVMVPAFAQFDDLYYDREAAKKAAKNKPVAERSENRTSPAVSEPVYDDYYGYEFDEESEYYSDYDYAYTTRIRRFHQPQPPLRYYSSFDYWYNDFYYDPFYDNNIGVNVFIGTPVFGWNRWNRWHMGNSWGFYNPYNRWNRWNRWNAWDAWAFNDPWGWNSFGWNSWNNCPPIYGWGNNIYYTNVYNNYGNVNTGGNVGGNNGGWGSNGVATRVVNQSRRDGGLVSSPNGRGTTRRLAGENPTQDGVKPSQTGLTTGDSDSPLNRTSPRASTRVYKGDSKNVDPKNNTPGPDTRRKDPTQSTEPKDRTSPRTSPKNKTDVPPNRDNGTRTPPTRGNDNGVSEPTRSTPPSNERTRSTDNEGIRGNSEPIRSTPSRQSERTEPSKPTSTPPSSRSGGGSESNSSRSSSRSGGGSESNSSRSSSRSGGGFESSSSRSSSSGSMNQSRSSGGFDSGSSRSSSSGSMNSGGSSRSSSGSSSSGSSSSRSGGSSRGGGRG